MQRQYTACDVPGFPMFTDTHVNPEVADVVLQMRWFFVAFHYRVGL